MCIRDRYRCGIPFAYVVECQNGSSETKFELQPSYQCGDNNEPLVLIVSPEFVELDESGHIKTLRDKIRNSGVTIEI